MPRYRSDVLHTQLDNLIDAAKRIQRDVPELIRRSRFVARDGYPSSSMGGSGGGSEISRPTESVALADPMPDITARRIAEILAGVDFLTGEIQRFDNDRAKVMAAEELKGIRVNLTPECANPNCGKALIGEDADKAVAGRCRPCYNYRRESLDLDDRPRHLVEAELARKERDERKQRKQQAPAA